MGQRLQRFRFPVTPFAVSRNDRGKNPEGFPPGRPFASNEATFKPLTLQRVDTQWHRQSKTSTLKEPSAVATTLAHE